MGIIGGMEHFYKTNKRRGWNKGECQSGWNRKQTIQIVEVDISNKHIYSYAVRFFKLFFTLA